jgi:PKD repeat protein
MLKSIRLNYLLLLLCTALLLADQKYKNEQTDGQTIWPAPGTTPTEGWLQTLWHQSHPFNARCPFDTVRQARSLVGCVGLAMAQILNYYHSAIPVKYFSDTDDYFFMQNSFSFRLDDDCGVYNTLKWGELNQALSRISYPIHDDSDSGLVDELCYAAGSAVQTMYSSTNSEASEAKIVQILSERFNLTSALYLPVSDSMLLPLLKRDMKNSEPAIIILTRGGLDAHAVVVDGFNEMADGPEDDLYHINYGGGISGETFWCNLWPANQFIQPISHGFDRIKGAVVHTAPLSALQQPIANFNVNLKNGYAPLTVRFEDQSLGRVMAWDWDFGDSSIHGSDMMVYHTYQQPGSYTVTLNVTGPAGQNTKSEPNLITAAYTPFRPSSISLPGFSDGRVIWSDYDADGDLDISLFGGLGNQVLRNDGTAFTPINSPVSMSNFFDCDWLDFDADGDLDVWLSYNTSVGTTGRLYRNDLGTFIPMDMSGRAFSVARQCWGDYDNDGDPDMLNTDPMTGVVQLYQNNDWLFTPTAQTLSIRLPAIWADVDNDTDLDIIAANGVLARNTNGRFVEEKLDWNNAYGIEISDCDNNGYPDLLLTNYNKTGEIKIYLNDHGIYRQAQTDSLPRSDNAYACWIDYDNDAGTDLLLGSQYTTLLTKFYHADADGQYRPITWPLKETNEGFSAFADFDHDDDPDFIQTGIAADGKRVAILYENVVAADFTSPAAPQNLSTNINGHQATLRWSAPETGKNRGCTYNLYVGTESGKGDVLSAHARRQDGRRLLVGPGNVWQNNHWKLQLPTGNYYWSIQTIDKGFNSSSFAPEAQFTIANDGYGAPTPPYNLQAIKETRGIILSWESDSSRPVYRYTIYRRNAGESRTLAVIGGNLTAFCDTQIVEGQEYEYSVRATNFNRQESEPSSSVTVDFSFLFVRHKLGIPQNFPAIFDLGDIDNDLDLDIVTGWNEAPNTWNLCSFINQNGSMQKTRLPWESFQRAMSINGDDDGDNDLDLLVSISSPWINFLLNTNKTFVPQSYKLIDSGGLLFIEKIDRYDLDNDGDRDALILGSKQDQKTMSLILQNAFLENTNGMLHYKSEQPFRKFLNQFDYDDYDLDGDIDIVACNNYNVLQPGAQYLVDLYINSSGTYKIADSTIIAWPLISDANTQVKWLDYNQDGRPDILLYRPEGVFLYINRGARFDSPMQINDMGQGLIQSADLNNDGQSDVIVSRDRNTVIQYRTTDGFIEKYCLDANVYGSIVTLGDLDQDGDLDLFLPNIKNGVVMLENTIGKKNNAPSAPESLTSLASGDSVVLSWSNASDAETAPPGLTYNLYVGTKSGGTDIVSPLSDLQTGFRKLVEPGNVGDATQRLLRRLSTGIYYWSVQAVDNGFIGGPFAIEHSFTIEPETAVGPDVQTPIGFSLQQNHPNPFNNQTVIRFSLAQSGPVSLNMFNLKGERVAALIDKTMTAGEHQVFWDGRSDGGIGLAGGVYLCRLIAGNQTRIKKIMMIK